jgi:cytidine deaminase
VDIHSLIEEALKARDRSYAPYSRFRVGAALETDDGKIFTGGNIENISFGLTMCAERVAVGNAIQSGSTSFSKIAIVSDSKEPVTPCGACRQVLAEFNSDLMIYSGNLAGKIQEFQLAILLPSSRQGILG